MMEMMNRMMEMLPSEPTQVASELMMRYQRREYCAEDYLLPLLESGMTERVGELFNHFERLRRMSEDVMIVSSWIIADMLSVLYRWYASRYPDWSFQDIVDAMYNFVGPDSFLAKSENTIYQYLRVVELFPPGDSRDGLSFNRALDAVTQKQYAERVAGDDAQTDVESFRAIVREVSESGGSRKDLSEALLRKLGGVGYPLLVMDGAGHRVLLAVSAVEKAIVRFGLVGSYTARDLMKRLVGFLKPRGRRVKERRLPFRLMLDVGDGNWLRFFGELIVDKSGQFPVVEIMGYEEACDAEVSS